MIHIIIPTMSAFRISTAIRSSLGASRLAPLQRTPFLNSKVLTHSPQRCYATDSTSAVAPPDYLDESERKIFGILKESLRPEKLEVS